MTWDEAHWVTHVASLCGRLRDGLSVSDGVLRAGLDGCLRGGTHLPVSWIHVPLHATHACPLTQRTVVRTGAGVCFGAVAGTLLMRRGWGGRGMLTMLAAGIGLGSAFSECQMDFREAEAKGKRFPRLRDIAFAASK